MTKLEKQFVATVLKQVAEEVWNRDNDWWTDADADRMEKIAAKLIK